MSTVAISTKLLTIEMCGGYRCYHGDCKSRTITNTRNITIPRYSCECHSGWATSPRSGVKCFTPCRLACQNGGSCLIQNDSPRCQCSFNTTIRYHGPLCADIWTTPATPSDGNTSHINIGKSVGIIVGVTGLALLVLIVAVFIMWKRRTIFLLKMVRKFRAYDDKDQKIYDAFISYKSSSSDDQSSPEEVFIINHLLPKLETEFGYKICVHYRDFSLGTSIAENVLFAIENSHRTIMLISRSYVEESIWTKFEYDQAHMAVIRCKQKIIPIIYENLANIPLKADDTLKNIIESTTYIQKPDETDERRMAEFWTRLNLAMPKKHPVDKRPNE